MNQEIELNRKQLAEEVVKWKRFYDSLKIQYEKLEKTNQDQSKNINMLTHSLNNADQVVTLHKDLLRKMTEEHSKKEQDLVEFMNRLKKKLRELGFTESFESIQ